VVDKQFFLGSDPTPIVDNRTYMDGSPVQASIANYPPVTVTIHEWQNIGIAQQNLIRTELVAGGYVEQ